MSENILEIKNISKSFPGVKALDDVSFNVKKGTVHALVGENGAGKSTLIKILAGIYRADCGEVVLDGCKITCKTPNDSQQAGISVVHQELKLAEPLSVMENIFLGNYIYKGKNGIIDWKTMRKKTKEMIGELGIPMDIDAPVCELTIAKKQIVEISKAINRQCKIIVMDEPSATLTDRELAVLFDIIGKLKRDGITVIYISHRLEEIFKIADYFTVLRDGKQIDTRSLEGVERSDLIRMIVGRELGEEYPKEEAPIGEVVLKAENISRKGVLRDISFEARKGEILGISGLVGSGRTELARAVLGIDRIDSGSLELNGVPVKLKDFKSAIKRSMGLVPEDRKTQGLCLSFSVKQNIVSVSVGKIFNKGVLSGKKEVEYAKKYVSLLQIATPSIDTLAENLSGGNQQKVVIAKWLMEDSQIIFMDEPTRGIDVGSKSEIYKTMTKLVRNGKTIIMISSELPEVLGMCDRILVMHEGRIVGELDRSEASQEKIISLCI